jgi:hypothetical protein
MSMFAHFYVATPVERVRFITAMTATILVLAFICPDCVRGMRGL